MEPQRNLEPAHDLYQAPQAWDRDAPVGDPDDQVLATRLQRFLASLGDGLLYGAGWAPLFLADKVSADMKIPMLGIGVVMLLAMLAINIPMLVTTGQTVCKRAVGIRIVRMTGELPRFGRIFLLRSVVPGLLGMVPGIGPLLGLADALSIFADDRRCLHDRIADTKVVQVRA